MSDTSGYTPAPADAGKSVVTEPEKPAPKKRTRAKRKDEVKAQRRRRKGVGAAAEMKLTVPDGHKDENYEYRWIRNEPGRVRRLTIEDDYDLVPDEAVAQDGEQAGLGVIPERHGGTKKDGSTYNMVLARKPKDYYEQDQKEKQKQLDEIEDQLKRGASQSPEGLAGPTAYVPDGGINVERGG